MGENCKNVRMSFHGSLEVISHQAFGTFLDHLDDCHRVLPWNNADHAHFKYYGGDKFAAWCMHAYGVDKVPSMQSVESEPEGPELDEMAPQLLANQDGWHVRLQDSGEVLDLPARDYGEVSRFCMLPRPKERCSV